MEYTAPHYYPRFHCIAGDCPETCCAGWAIMIDEKALKRYHEMNSPFGTRLRNSINWKEGCFEQTEGRCAFLNEENLCDIYTEAGAGNLCRTCRNFPRHIEEFEGVREISLSLSCPVAAELILGCKEKVTFIERVTDHEESYPYFDFFLYTKLLDTRALALKLIQDRTVEIELSMAIVLGLGHDLQRRIRNGRLYETDQLLERYKRDGAAKRFKKLLNPFRIGSKQRFGPMKELFQVLKTLEHLRKEWPEELAGYETALYGDGAEAYGQVREAYLACLLQNQEKIGLMRVWKEQLMVYFLFLYLCGGVYDENPYGKIKLAVISTLLIEELAFAEWITTGRLVTFSEFCRLAGRYSREVEHSDPNLCSMEKQLGKESFRLKVLLSILCSD